MVSIVSRKDETDPLRVLRQPVYWHIDDLDCQGPEKAIPLLEEAIHKLLDGLQNEGSECDG